ncbi:MAG: PaaI family thioesterase [Novosphingobium sp.]
MRDEQLVAVPPGYELWVMRGGFGELFGPVYMDRANCRMAFRVDRQHTNPVEGLHGGAMATFIDANIAVCYTRPDMHCPTINLTVDYMRPAKQGDLVEADVSMLRVTKNLVFMQSIVRVGETPIARANGVYRNDGIPAR